MATRTDLYTSKWLPEHILPRRYWEVLKNHEMRFRLKGPVGYDKVSGYLQVRIHWEDSDKWVFAGELTLPLSSNVFAAVIEQAERFRVSVKAELGPPRPHRSHHASETSFDDLQRIKRFRRARKADSSDAGRSKANKTLERVLARRGR